MSERFRCIRNSPQLYSAAPPQVTATMSNCAAPLNSKWSESWSCCSRQRLRLSQEVRVLGIPYMRVGRLISWLSSYINITAGMLCVVYQMTVSSSFCCSACTVIDSKLRPIAIFADASGQIISSSCRERLSLGQILR